MSNLYLNIQRLKILHIFFSIMIKNTNLQQRDIVAQGKGKKNNRIKVENFGEN